MSEPRTAAGKYAYTQWSGAAIEAYGVHGPEALTRDILAIEAEALAAERKATVERIRAAAIQVDVASHGELSMHDLDAILDAEAAP